MIPPLPPPDLDREAVHRWQERLAAHLLGAGLVLAVLAALPAAPTDLDRHQLPKESVVHAVTWLAVALLRPGLGLLSRATRTALIALLVVTALSALFASNRWLALRATGLTLTGIAAFLAAHHLALRGLGPLLLRWVGVAAAAGTASGLAQAHGISSPFFATTRLPGGTFGNRNFLAHFAAITLPVLALLTLTAPRWFHALVPSLASAALLGTVVLTRSRAAWLASVAAGGIILLATGYAKRRGAMPVARSRVAMLAVALIVGPLMTLTMPNALNWRSDSPYAETLTGIANAQEGSGRGRVLQYRNTLKLAVEHPVLGVGPGNWPLRYGDVAPPTDPSWVWGDDIPINPWPSSDWMALVSERGPLGVLSVLLLGMALVWRAASRLHLAGEEALRAATLLGILAAVAVVGAFDAVMLLPVPLLGVALCVGALSVADSPDPIPTDAWPWWRRALPVLLCLMLLRSAQQSAAYVVAGSGRHVGRLVWAARLDPTSYPLRLELAARLPCARARAHARAVRSLAPQWPASQAAARRCGVR